VKKGLGYFLVGLGMAITWPIQIGCFAYGIYYIVTAFINTGVIGGLVSMGIVSVCLLGLHFLIYIISTPLRALAGSLIEGEKDAEMERQKTEMEYLASERLKSEKEIAHAQQQLKKAYMAQGMTEEEADEQINQDKQAIDAELAKL